jgi:hypothetical protein
MIPGWLRRILIALRIEYMGFIGILTTNGAKDTKKIEECLNCDFQD